MREAKSVRAIILYRHWVQKPLTTKTLMAGKETNNRDRNIWRTVKKNPKTTTNNSAGVKVKQSTIQYKGDLQRYRGYADLRRPQWKRNTEMNHKCSGTKTNLY